MQKKNKRREAAFVFHASINEQAAYGVGIKARQRRLASIKERIKARQRRLASIKERRKARQRRLASIR